MILKKVTPLFDTMLLKRLENDGAQTIEIFSKHIAKILQQSATNDPHALSEVLQDTISEAISEEIANNRDVMIDALYPIMGGMISKYVTQAIKEMMENINSKIEDGLSFNRYKRKLKSKVSGVSETELLLEESSDTTVSSLFIIQKESGLLVAEAYLEDNKIDDPHMVASMASAIKDFINDWVQSHKEQSEVQILSYGDATLYIESAGSVYLIAFLDAEPDHQQRLGINTLFASVLKKYIDFFQSFDGDDSAVEVDELSAMLQKYLNSQTISEENSSQKLSKKPVKNFFIILGLASLVYMGFYLKEVYTLYQLEKEVEKHIGYSVTIESEDDGLTVSGSVNSFEDAQSILKQIEKKTDRPLKERMTMPLSKVYQTMKDEQLALIKHMNAGNEENHLRQQEFTKRIHTVEERVERSSNIQMINDLLLSLQKIDTSNSMKQKEFTKIINTLEEKIDKSSNSSIIDDLSTSLENINKMLDGLESKRVRSEDRLDELKEYIKWLKIKESISSSLEKASVSNSLFNAKDGALDFSGVKLFTAGSTILSENSKQLIKSSFEEYIESIFANEEAKEYIEALVIEGHTDSSGDPDNNQKLSKIRADNVRNYILTLQVVQTYGLKQLFITKGFGNQFPVIRGGVENKDASRRIKIKYILKSTGNIN